MPSSIPDIHDGADFLFYIEDTRIPIMSDNENQESPKIKFGGKLPNLDDLPKIQFGIEDVIPKKKI